MKFSTSKLIILAFSLTLSFACAFFIFLNVLFFTPMGSFTSQLDTLKKSNFLFIFPQGWAFFTRDPKVDLFYFYKIEPSKIDLVSDQPFRIRNYLGLNRSTRYIFEESEHLGKLLLEDQWTSCEDEFENCVGKIPQDKKITLYNQFPLARLCGTYYVKSTRTTPLVFVGLDKGLHREPFMLARVNIQCSKK